jgi:hypothetical protein
MLLGDAECKGSFVVCSLLSNWGLNPWLSSRSLREANLHDRARLGSHPRRGPPSQQRAKARRESVPGRVVNWTWLSISHRDVIPVILTSCKAAPELPLFLRSFGCVDYRTLDADPLEQLVWGLVADARKAD